SIPLQGLPGTPASATPIAAPAPLARSNGIVEGAYECWAFSQARPLLNFTIRSGGTYIGSDGKSGAFSFDAAFQRVIFTTGALSNVLPAGFYTIYYEPQGRPTVSFRNSHGDEESFCQKQ